MVEPSVSNVVAPNPPAVGLPALPEFPEIFATHFRYCWLSLKRLGVNGGDLEDLTHEVFLRVHAQLLQHDPERPLRPWIFNIALGLASNYRRLARHRLQFHAEPPERIADGPSADERLIANERNAMVQRALEQVPLQHRAVLILHDMDEVAVPQIATSLGIGTNTAYSRLRLGREAFRRALEKLQTRGGSK